MTAVFKTEEIFPGVYELYVEFRDDSKYNGYLTIF